MKSRPTKKLVKSMDNSDKYTFNLPADLMVLVSEAAAKEGVAVDDFVTLTLSRSLLEAE